MLSDLNGVNNINPVHAFLERILIQLLLYFGGCEWHLSFKGSNKTFSLLDAVFFLFFFPMQVKFIDHLKKKIYCRRFLKNELSTWLKVRINENRFRSKLEKYCFD